MSNYLGSKDPSEILTAEELEEIYEETREMINKTLYSDPHSDSPSE